MAVERYKLSLLKLEECALQFTPDALLLLLKAWRKSHTHGSVCSECHQLISFRYGAYDVHCNQFYFNNQLRPYPVRSITIATPGYTFMLPQLARMVKQARIDANQEFLVLPDPIYWQVPTTLVYEKVLKFVLGQPMTCRTQQVQPPTKAPDFYKQIQKAPLNYGSLESRACGKATMIRQVAFGKRCKLSMRGMIVPDPTLRPNEIRIPDHIVEKFKLKGQWIILNRMPSLQPENFVGLQVPREGNPWPHDCFGIPLSILAAIQGDFDGDETNLYLVPGRLSQAECATILNPESEMRSFVMGLKLAPCQDMLVAYHLFYDDIDFLPIKERDLKQTLLSICEVYGSKAAFEAFNDLRLFYLDALQNKHCFALTFEEMQTLERMLRAGEDIRNYECCLTTQIRAKAKGNFESLQQMFGQVGMQSGKFVKSSFLSGLDGPECAAHGRTAITALYLVSHIWLPGYGYQKTMSNGHSMVVTYAGSIMDGPKRIVFKDALDAYHHEDIISAGTFQHIFKEIFEKKKA